MAEGEEAIVPEEEPLAAPAAEPRAPSAEGLSPQAGAVEAMSLPAPTPTPPPAPPPPAPRPSVPFHERLVAWLRALSVFLFRAEPTFGAAWLRFSLLALVLYSRLPTTNYIFDEQEALLANPYVNATGGLRFIDAIYRDFWGLPADRSVGSYRPIPNFLWRATWQISKAPFFHHVYNLLFHALGAALLVVVVRRLTRQPTVAWLTGLVFVTAAILTEAVSGIVGIADVLGGVGAILALGALLLPGWAMPFGVFAAILFGLFCKESALVCVPLVPFAALLLAPLTHPGRPRAAARTVLALAASVAAFVLYVELRKVWFPSPLPAELTTPLPDDAGRMSVLMREFMVWFHQAPLPRDPLNNPLIDAPPDLRVAGALRVYFRGLLQVVFPLRLSGDYSYPQEPVPGGVFLWENVAGGFFMVFPLVLAPLLWLRGLVRDARARREAAPTERRVPASRGESVRGGLGAFLVGLSLMALAVELFVLRPQGRSAFVLGLPFYVLALPAWLLGLGLLTDLGAPGVALEESPSPVSYARLLPLFVALGGVWVVVSYFPHSNIPVLLPTVRAERFWYFPVIGSSLLLGAVFASLVAAARTPELRRLSLGLVAAFLAFQGFSAYRHAMDYRDDLTFWDATRKAVPLSAKAHLNYSVMVGARGDLVTRFEESRRAIELADDWAMAHIYTADALCRLDRLDESWPYYQKGFDLGPNEPSLIALALQCLYDKQLLPKHEDALKKLAEEHRGSWLAYLINDTLENGEKNGGVDPKYRPRGYNEGPKEESE